MKIILLGAPGAGKGTQAEVICNRYNIPAISTGNIIREALKTGTEMGLKAKSYMESGALVPDEVVIGIIKERIVKDDCKDGFILDGFPRTIPQAEALDKMGIVIDKVCEKCGASYHLEYKKPKVEGICDACSGTLIQRKDDHPDTVKSRLDVYHSETEPLKDYYEKQGKLTVVEGQEEIEATTRLLIEALEA